MLQTVTPKQRSIEAPFDTENVTLAFALYVAGQPFADPACPCVNVYDADNLKRLGYSGLSLKAATEAAVEDKKKGQVRYGFKKTPLLGELLAAFDEQQAALKTSNESAADIVAAIMVKLAGGLYTREEAVLRLACVFLKTRTLFMDLPFDFEPWLRVHKKGSPSGSPESGRVRMPGFVIAPLSQAEKLFKELGL